MTFQKTAAVLLGSVALASLAVPAFAQETAPAAPEATASAEDQASEIEFLKAQLESMQTQIADLQKAAKDGTPTFKAAPEFKGQGFSFKPKGFVQFDAGYVGNPDDRVTGTGLGWGSRFRRLVFGAEGSMPGGFGYKVELNLAQSTVDYEDVVLTWQKSGSPFIVTVGNFYPSSSLETMTSSRLGSFMERAAFTEAFNYNRRLGAAVGLVDPADRYTLTAGVWNQEINTNTTASSRTAWQGSIRGTFSPTIGSTRLHLGANYQHRQFQKDALAMTYQSRAFTQVSDQRFVGTGGIAAKGDDIVGVELGAIHGPLHFAGEAQYVWTKAIKPTDVLAPGEVTTGTRLLDNPKFFGGYAEVGYYLTGESRGYKGGKWDRTKVLNPIDKGGMGAWQVNARFDYLDLQDRVATSAVAATNNSAPFYVNGGKQEGYLLSVIWNPMDYIRFLAQYGRTHVTGGSLAATVVPVSADPAKDRSYNVDMMALRAQVEF